MSQYDFGTIDPYVVDGVQLAGMLNQWRDAIHSMHRGASRPSYAVPGLMWINDAGGASSWVVNVFLGAIGDRPLFTYDTVTGNITWSASASGTLSAAILLAQASTLPSVRWASTSNPIDQKNWRSTVMNDGSLRFSAYNDAGVESSWIQFNRDGTITNNPASPSLRLYSETVLAAVAQEIRVTMPANAKKVRLEWMIQTVSGFDGMLLQAMQGATPVISANYALARDYGNVATPTSDQLTAQTNWFLFTFGTSFGGVDLTPAGTGTAWLVHGEGGSAAANRISFNWYGDLTITPSTITGWRFASQTPMNWLVGSWARLYAVL